MEGEGAYLWTQHQRWQGIKKSYLQVLAFSFANDGLKVSLLQL